MSALRWQLDIGVMGVSGSGSSSKSEQPSEEQKLDSEDGLVSGDEDRP